ncbi:hypothetical protein BC835DRAFT_1520799 [Cytidiella melzeri]|nr:hypothetical protein BC835DRAFT_1520799 [Cytidiella melzeri]
MAWKSQQNANETPIIPITVGATASLSLPDIHPHRPYAPVARVRSESPSSVLQRMDTNEDGLFQDDCGQPIHFTAGEDEEQILNQALNQRIEDLNCYSHESLGDFWGSNTDTGNLDDEEDEEILAEHNEAGHDNHRWAPYQTKIMFMLDFLDSLPHLRLSDDHLKTIMWVMIECGTPDVPLFSALRKLQTKLTIDMGIQTTRHVSTMGNEFYSNSAAQMFHLDWANPLVRPHIRPYVEVSSTISEFYQAERLMNTDVDLLQLMWADFKRAPGQHFYIKELACLQDGRFVIPMKWLCIIDKTTGAETECADVYHVDYEITTGVAHLHIDKVTRILATDLMSNILDLKNQGLEIRFDGVYGTEVDTRNAPSNDVSGNRSKQYNAHTNVYSANLNLPHHKLQQEYFVRFSSTSPTATALEQLDGFVEDIGPDHWHDAYDCLLKQEILFRLIVRVEPADNPQQSELCSHIGLNGNKFCRKCHAGGPAKEMETHVGYHSLYKEGVARTADETAREIVSQLVAATRGNEQNIEAMQTASGIKDPIAQFWIQQLIQKARSLHHKHISNAETQDSRLKDRKLKGQARQAVKNEISDNIERELVKWLTEQPAHRYSKLAGDSPLRTQIRPGDHYNKLLVLEGLDVHRDTIVELLHTYLLGLDKYVWHASHLVWNDVQRQLMAIRLQSSSVDRLSIFPVQGDYLVKYRNNLIGKHFKALQQVGVFHLHPDLLESEHGSLLLKIWKATGELGALLFYHAIDDMSTYLEDLEVLIGNLLDVWGAIDPNRILNKPKIHLLQHIITDIRNGGPAILFSTEIFECWNSIFRMCSVLSNHHAPSHDIAAAIADLERFKHQVSGDTLWEYAHSLASRSADVCKEGSWVFYERPDGAVNGDTAGFPARGCLTYAGRIRRILIPTSDPRGVNGLVEVERFAVSAQPDTRLNMPVLYRECASILVDVVPVQKIAFIFNAQHDCLTAECTIGDQSVRQERRITSLTQKVVKHGVMQRYFVNMHALHNAALIRNTLPRHFSKPKPFYNDRAAKHQEFADKVSSVNNKRRDAAAAKARDTRARKKQVQELQMSQPGNSG